MQILNSKRIIFLSIFAILPIFIASISNSSQKLVKSKTIDTVAMPVTSKTIVLDSGHRR